MTFVLSCRASLITQSRLHQWRRLHAGYIWDYNRPVASVKKKLYTYVLSKVLADGLR